VKNLDRRFKKRSEQKFPEVSRKRGSVYVLQRAGSESLCRKEGRPGWFMSSKRQAGVRLCRVEGRPGSVYVN